MGTGHPGAEERDAEYVGFADQGAVKDGAVHDGPEKTRVRADPVDAAATGYASTDRFCAGAEPVPVRDRTDGDRLGPVGE